MDLEEWEYISDEGFLEIHDDGGNKIFSRKKHWKIDPNIMFKDYFKNPQFVDSTQQKVQNPMNFPNQIIPIPIQFHPPNQEQEKQRIEIPDPFTAEPIKIESRKPEPIKVQDDREVGSQIFFKKTKETHEFVDMKLDSPSSGNRVKQSIENPIPVSTEPIKIESKIPEPIKIEDDREVGSQIFFKKTKETHEFVEMKLDSPRSGNRVIVGESMGMKKDLREDEGLNIWKWGLSGIGAICSFGVVAATVCIVILGTGKKQSHPLKIRFHVYQDDNKRGINDVVHNTNKLNEAISAAKGVPLSRAHITFGGYFDDL